jgi:murein DD-endopeptidase MepM/ murein hydrolase activator NlpD
MGPRSQKLHGPISLCPGWALTAGALAMICLAPPALADAESTEVSAFTGNRPFKEYQLGARAQISPIYPRCTPKVISEFGASTDPTGAVRASGPHNGIDLGKFGDDVLAMASGTVSSAKHSEWGNTVRILHGRDKDGLDMYTTYGHLQEMVVQKGDEVRRGQKIGTVGHSGKAAGPFPHVHVMVLKYKDDRNLGAANLNPHRFWLDGHGRVTCFDSQNELHTDPSRYQGDDRVNGIRLTYPLRCDCK